MSAENTNNLIATTSIFVFPQQWKKKKKNLFIVRAMRVEPCEVCVCMRVSTVFFRLTQ